MNIENIKPGDFITILSWEPKECPLVDVNDPEHKQVGKIVIPDNSWVGDLLEVLATDPPFIAVSIDKYKGSSIQVAPQVIDTRKCKWNRCSDEYVEALRVKL